MMSGLRAMANSDFDLSIIIPARNEEFLALTVSRILSKLKGKTEVIVVMDGYWSQESLPLDSRLSVLHYEESVGQRAACNRAASIAAGKWLMKIDAHCDIEEGMDVKMLDAIQGHPNWTMVPKLYNLHGFDWVCEKGHREYQSPTPTNGCRIKEDEKVCGAKVHREIVWKPRWNKESTHYRFDTNMKFKYWGAFKHRAEGKTDISPTLSLQGSCFMLSKEKWFELDICDEKHGSWGQQGTEVACKTWLSGGEVMVNKKTWYSHLFRTQGGDFGFPYPLSGSDTDKAREYSRWLFKEGNWDGAIHDLNWLLEKFRPVPEWHFPVVNGKVKKSAIYYTNNRIDQNIQSAVTKQISKGIKPKHIVSVSHKPMNFGKNIVVDYESGYISMAKQILDGLRASEGDVVFFLEHDVLYHSKHFDFMPSKHDVIYYNTNIWRVRYEDGHALYCDGLQQLSGLVAYKDVLIKHFEKRVDMLEKKQEAINLEFMAGDRDNEYEAEKDFGSYVRAMGFEPGTHNRKERVDYLTAESYQAEYPNIDIRHDNNLTPSRWRKDQFRNEKYTKGWKELDGNQELPGWGRINDVLEAIKA